MTLALPGLTAAEAACPDPALRVQEVAGLGDDALRQEWQRLAAQDDLGGFFAGPGFVSAFADQMHDRAAEVLSQVLGLPVLVHNDADCFALAEAGMGAGRGHRNVFGIILGTGVGGGLVIDGRIVTGAGGYAGEWGHGPALNAAEVPWFACGCGQSGCIDTVGGARGLERLDRYVNDRSVSSHQIVQGWQAGDRAAARTVDLWAELLSGPLAMVLNVLGASVVPVGGGLSTAPALIARLDGAVRARLLRQATRPLLVPAELRVEPGLVGASLAGFGAMTDG